MYYLNIVNGTERYRCGNLVFANEESAFWYGINYLGPHQDFEIEPLVDERPDAKVISLCDYRAKRQTQAAI